MLINLHSHLEGRVRPGTAAELAAELGAPEPEGGWQRALQLDAPADLTGYLAKVAASYPFFRSPESARRIAREAVTDAAAAGQDYLELRFGPATHVDDVLGLSRVITAVADGMAQASQDTGMPSGLVIAALRHHDAETNEAVARAAAAAAGAGVVGFDLAGDELLFPELEPYVDAFAIARASGLGITCHAAEAAPGRYARAAVELLGATRIGHGAHLGSDPAALAWLRGARVAIEICPTSNWFTGAIDAVAKHPARLFRDAGVALVLGDDNPTQTGSDLAAERRVLGEQLGFTDDDLRLMDQASIAAAFLEPAVRVSLTTARPNH